MNGKEYTRKHKAYVIDNGNNDNKNLVTLLVRHGRKKWWVGWSEILTLKKGISGHYIPMNCLVHGKISQTWFQINMWYHVPTAHKDYTKIFWSEPPNLEDSMRALHLSWGTPYVVQCVASLVWQNSWSPKNFLGQSSPKNHHQQNKKNMNMPQF